MKLQKDKVNNEIYISILTVAKDGISKKKSLKPFLYLPSN